MFKGLIAGIEYLRFFLIHFCFSCRDFFNCIPQYISNKLFDFDTLLCNLPKDISRLNLEVFPYVNKIKLIQEFYSFPGIKKVAQLFPEEDDPYLSSLFVLDVESSKLQLLLKSLQKDNRIKQLEPVASRKLL